MLEPISLPLEDAWHLRSNGVFVTVSPRPVEDARRVPVRSYAACPLAEEARLSALLPAEMSSRWLDISAQPGQYLLVTPPSSASLPTAAAAILSLGSAGQGHQRLALVTPTSDLRGVVVEQLSLSPQETLMRHLTTASGEQLPLELRWTPP